ncbi:mannose-1-phosphate guanylyltransferase [Paragonimus westermani]|uniref:Mannose-1-phosphate guanylyltransferase n=1 Tax=Paragonimus westermani TaxID=34504 RepID=A0A5J4NUX9_9TREM|nr:mannose-1-phosphate guanylyltransferase [Paragonimus westermani]
MVFVDGSSKDGEKKIKAIILIGGPCKGTRFRPLSLDLPKPLFPIGGFPVIYHHIEAFVKLSGLQEIILLGFYQPSDALTQLINSAQREFGVTIRYLQEFTALGTAGGIYQFRDQLLSGSPDLLFVMNGDICCDLPLEEMLEFHKSLGPGDRFVLMATEATRQQSLKFGCIVENPETHEVLHYAEKPTTFVSTTINCGIYLFTPGIFKFIRIAFLEHQNQISHELRTSCKEIIHLEREICQPLAGSGTLFVYHTTRFWSQIKFAGAVIYANRHVLSMYERIHPHRLARMSVPSCAGLQFLTNSNQLSPIAMNGDCSPNTVTGPIIVGHVFIHPTATIDPSAVLGPNVSVGERAVIRGGVRLRDCIVLRDAEIREHACCLNAVIGWNTIIGKWARVEGTPNDPNPNKPFSKLEVLPVFNAKGQLNPSITVIGSNVEVPAEIIVLNCIVLPHKELAHSSKNQIIL